jgi:thymidylate kinase
MRIVSFSGIDGAGKSTQIHALETWLRAAGLTTKPLTFWDDVVLLSRFREFISLRAFRGDAGAGTPEQPINRRDKNVTSWPVTAMRFGFYLIDAVSLRFKIQRMKKREVDVVIFDRYIYDELANLPTEHWLARAFICFVLKLAPQPDVAYLIDADPVQARARKPEYPLEFLCRNRESYLALTGITSHIVVIPPSSVAETEEKMLAAFLAQLSTEESTFSAMAAMP